MRLRCASQCNNWHGGPLRLLGAPAPLLAHPNRADLWCAAPCYGGRATPYLDRDASFRRRLSDPLDGTAHAILPPLGVGGLEELGDSWPRMGADWRLAGATQLQFEVEPRPFRPLDWGLGWGLRRRH